MKVAVVGGGSTYTPELVDGFARLRSAGIDVDPGRAQPGEPVDEFGSVRGPATDNRYLHA